LEIVDLEIVGWIYEKKWFYLGGIADSDVDYCDYGDNYDRDF